MEKIAHVASAVAAMRAGPMSDEAFADYNHRMSWVNLVSTSNPGKETSQLAEAVRSWANAKKQIVHAEMAHRWRVDAVTQRYQQHMEKARCAPVPLLCMNQLQRDVVPGCCDAPVARRCLAHSGTARRLDVRRPPRFACTPGQVYETFLCLSQLCFPLAISPGLRR
jgi:hypothetical protein